MKKEDFISQVSGKLIVSCQALPGEPLYLPEGGIMPLMAKAAFEAGAAGIRCNGIKDILDIKQVVPLPVIGIIKKKYDGFDSYITPSMVEIDTLVKIGVDVIAIDATDLTRPGNINATDFIKKIKEKYPEQLLMADCSSLSDSKRASEAGADFIGTTLNGYIDKKSSIFDPPAFELVEEIIKEINTPLIAEGRIRTPSDATKMLSLGALAVVVGSAITRPKEITRMFTSEINIFNKEKNKRSKK